MKAMKSDVHSSGITTTTRTTTTTSLLRLDASKYCWNAIWKAEEGHLKLPILDAIQLSSQGNIIGWLFTATDGSIKSKSKNRWNEACVLDRCSGYNQKIGAHITSNGMKWNNGNDSILHNSFLSTSDVKAIVSFNHLNIQTPYFIEHTYTKAEPLPKMSTSLFCDSKAKGKFNESDKDIDHGIFPPYRILNMNKKINEVAKNYITELVKAIESRERIKIIKLVTVLLHEADDRIERDTKIWLHHVDEIVYEELNTTTTNNNDNDRASSIYASSKASYRESFNNSDMKSVTYSEVSYGQASFHRLHKCQGDFCQYNEEDEQQQINLEGYDGANIIEASKKARLQFRKVTGGDTKKLKETLEDPTMFSSPDKVDLAEREEGLDGITIGGGKERKDEHDENTPPALKKKSQSRFVPYKSIALARQDMADLEAAQETSFVHSPVPWTELLYHWYWRAGRSIVQKKGSVPVPISAGHKIGVAMISNRHNNIMKKDDKNDNGTNDSFHKLDSHILTSKDDSIPPHGLARKPLFKKDDDSVMNEVDPQKVGQFSWYYSDARVCEHCYKVYKDLDRRRTDKQVTLLKAQKKALEPDEIERGKELEKRMFYQRKQASRLAKPSTKKITSEPSHSNIYAEPSAITDPFGDNSVSQLHHNQNRKPLVGIPKGFLPPLPWNLTNPEQRESYQNAGSTFAKSLKSKTEQLRELNNHEQKMKELQHMRKKMLGGMLDEESAILEEPSAAILERDELEEWYKATGRYKDPNEAEEIQRPIRNANKKEVKTVDPRTFDAARLLHPWQRDFNKMREQYNKKQNKKSKKKMITRDDEYDYDEDDDHNNDRAEQQYQPSATMKTLQKFEQLKSKAKGPKGKMNRSNSLPPMAMAPSMQMSQITLDSNIKSTVGGSISSTILNDNSYKGFTGLGRHNSSNSKYEESDTNANKSLKQLQNFEKSISKTSINDNKDNSNAKPLSQSSKRVIFDESSMTKSTKSPSPVKNIKYSKHYDNDDDDEDDGDDDDDDDDEGIGWSPFVVSGM